MKKSTAYIFVSYSHDSAHSGAPYTVDGNHYMNAGQFIQFVRTAVATGKAVRPDNVPYNKGCDIPELFESVKSSKATLVNMYLGETLESVLETYLATTAALYHTWNFIVDDELITYTMELDEFAEFVKEFAYFDKARKVVRFKAHSTKMVKWFESRL